MILIVLVGLGLLVGWFLWNPTSSTEPRAPAEVAAEDSRTKRATTLIPNTHRFSLSEGQEAEIRLTDVPVGQPLTLTLKLAGEERSDFGIKSAWIYQESRDPLELRAVRTGNDTFRVDLNAASLLPGRAIVELRTDESSPLALRRFAVQIR